MLVGLRLYQHVQKASAYKKSSPCLWELLPTNFLREESMFELSFQNCRVFKPKVYRTLMHGSQTGLHETPKMCTKPGRFSYIHLYRDELEGSKLLLDYQKGPWCTSIWKSLNNSFILLWLNMR